MFRLLLGGCLAVVAHTLALPGVAFPASGRVERWTCVVTQLPPGTAAEKAGPRSGGMLASDWGQGARLVLVSEGKPIKVLTPGFASAADPDVSVDGTRILFAGQKQESERWAIYEMDADGKNDRLVFAAPDDLRQPVYFSTVYTIIADPTKGTEPREHIGFVRTLAGTRSEHGDAPTCAVYSVKLDGTEPRRLNHSLSSAMHPLVLQDGRIVYAAWQRATLDHGLEGRISLLGVNPDGLDMAIFSADEGQRIKIMPCVTPPPGRLVVFVEAQRLGWDGAGSLACVSLKRNLHSHRRITAESDGLFHSPSALPDGTILAARRPADGSGTHEIVRIDPVSGAAEVFFDDPAYHDMQPRALLPRPRPDGRSSGVKDPDEERAKGHKDALKAGIESGKLYGLNVYLNDLGCDLEPGTIARLRIIEGLQQSAGARPSLLAPRRLIGEVPVEADGSFHAEVPAGIPLQLQIVDGDGLALRTSGWVWTQYKGRQGCIGCHEDGELTPSNRFVDALGKPAARLLLPAARRRAVDFQHEIAPLILSRCAPCHGEGKDPQLTGKDCYDMLGRFLTPGKARTSRLIWHLFGRNTARPWDGPPALEPAKPMPGDSSLTADERRLFVEWIDLGALRDARIDERVPEETANSATTGDTR